MQQLVLISLYSAKEYTSGKCYLIHVGSPQYLIIIILLVLFVNHLFDSAEAFDNLCSRTLKSTSFFDSKHIAGGLFEDQL